MADPTFSVVIPYKQRLENIELALSALADPVRRSIVRQLAGCPDWSRTCGSFDLSVEKATGTHHFATLRRGGALGEAGAGEKRREPPRRIRRTGSTSTCHSPVSTWRSVGSRSSSRAASPGS